LIHFLHGQGFHVLGTTLADRERADRDTARGYRKRAAGDGYHDPSARDRKPGSAGARAAARRCSAISASTAMSPRLPSAASITLKNGRQPAAPASSWYFDLAVQGEGITDVTTHLVDLCIG